MRDGTGIEVRGEGDRHARKHGGARRRVWRVWRVWRKVHLAVDESTLEVRAVEIAGSHGGDGEGRRHRFERNPNVLPDLLGQIPEGAAVGSVTADGAYDTRTCDDAVAGRDADALGHSLGPVAFMPSRPPRHNAEL